MEVIVELVEMRDSFLRVRGGWSGMERGEERGGVEIYVLLLASVLDFVFVVIV